MPPKPRKDSAPSIQPEDYTQDVLVVVTVHSCKMQLGLLASPELAAPQPLEDAAAAPNLQVELHYSTTPVPVVSAPLTLGSDFTLACKLEHMFTHRKGPDVIDRLINSSLTFRLASSTSRAVLATASVDLLPFGLGSSTIEDGVLPWQPTTTYEPLKVLPGSTLALSVVLKHQPRPAAPVTAVPAPSSSSGSTTAAAAAAAAATAATAAAAAALQAALEPFCPLSPADAAGCNVLQFSAHSAAPLPANWAAAAHAAAGGLTCTLQLLLPSAAGRPVSTVKCNGGCSSGAQLDWPRQQQPSRVHLSTAASAALKAHLELGQPLLLEVARYLTGSAADTAVDPAFGAYHAVLQLGAAAEQLQELGAVSAAGVAVPIGSMSWALQQGRLAATSLPAVTAPASARPKLIEEAPPAPAEGQAPMCAWLAAGTRFNVSVRLARPLWEPWQPPAQPSRQLTDLFQPRPEPGAPAAPLAADRLRAKIQEIAHELAGQYVQQARSSDSSSGSSNLSSIGLHNQQQLVFELNSSGQYITIKQQLRPLLVDLVQERYTSAGGRPSAAGVQELHHDLYRSLVQELHAALAEVAKQAAKHQQQVQANALQHGRAPEGSTNLQQQGPRQELQLDLQQARQAQRLLRLATECELQRGLGRCHDLHMRRIAVMPSAEAWFDYACFCIRCGSHATALTALQEALVLDLDHTDAASALLCLSVAGVLGVDSPECSPEPAAAETAEVLAHNLKDRRGADVVPWALLALLYRSQGKAKEVSARSCHQEVLRQSKAALAVAAAAATEGANTAAAAAAAAAGANAPDTGAAAPSAAAEPVQQPAAPPPVAHVMPAANGYLAAAELVLRLNLPGLGLKLLELATGLKDAEGVLTRRLNLAHARAAVGVGDVQQALLLLRGVAEGLSDSTDEEKGIMQLLLGDTTYQAGNLALAKQHYRRALQKCPQYFSPRIYLQLGDCFMSSGDAVVTADMLAACIAATPTSSVSSPAAGPAQQLTSSATSRAHCLLSAVGTAVDWLVPGRCASVWLKLALAYARLGDVRSAELALSEANLCDPEHPAVWGHLALLALQQGREGEAGQALKQAQRCKLDSADLLEELGCKYMELGRLDSATDCLARAVAARDGVKARCKLAAVLLSQHDYDGCWRQLSAAAQLPADESEAAMLEDVVKKLQVHWPLL